MKNLALGLGLVGTLALSALPASADCADPSMHSKMESERSITSNLESGSIGPGDILSFNEPLEVTGTVDSRRTGLVHLTTAEGIHLIVPETLEFWRGHRPASAMGLEKGAMTTVVIPANHNWVVQGGANVPFAADFAGQDVILLGGYDGTIWIPRSTLLQADLDFVSSSGVKMDGAEAAELDR